MDDSRSDVLILGAGVSGLSAAYFLASQGHLVRVIDAYDHVGGNHISRNIGNYTYDIGAIFFWSDNCQFDMFEGLIDMCVPLDVSISKISPSGTIIQYPFSFRDEVLNQGPLEQAASVGSLIKARLFQRDIRSAADFARFHMGTHLYERTGLRTYLDRFYGLSGEEVSLAFAERRMRWLRKYGSARYWLSRGLGAARVQMGGRAPPAQTAYARPREGFQRYYGRIGENLSKMGVDIHLSNSIRSIDAADHGHVVHSETGSSFFGSRLISTMPVAMTAQWAGLPVAGGLVSLNLTTLFCSYAGPSAFDGTVLYNFHAEGAWKRLTMHSAYYGPVAGRSYFAVECTHLADNVSASSLFDDFICHVRKLRVFDGDLRLEGSMTLTHAYPVYRHGFEAALHPLIHQLNSRGIELLGRQGRFDYIPSSAMAIDLVREALGS